VGLVLEERGVAARAPGVVTARGEGRTTSGSFSPTLGCAIAFARVPASVCARRRVRVEVRQHLLEARVSHRPSVRTERV